MPNLFININGDQKIYISKFVQQILDLFPDEAFEVFGFDEYGPFDLQINYREWKPYKKGVKLGQNKGKIAKILELPQETKRDLYYKFILISGFWEGYSTSSLDIMSKDTWKLVKSTLKYVRDHLNNQK
jgi:hypothetical protein